MGERRGATGFRLVNLREGDHLEDPSLYGIFKKWGGGYGLD